MIREIATIEIDSARAAEFEAAVAQAEPLFAAAVDCFGMTLHRSLDHPGQYVLIVGWASVEAHMVGFRSSPEFQAWRALAGPFFVSPPVVDHVAQAVPTVRDAAGASRA